MTATVVILASIAAGCGGSGGGRLDVAAATSLKEPLSELAATGNGAAPRLEFAGSDSIAAAIRAGRRPDVVVLAGEAIPGALSAAGLVSRPVPVATNRLVIATRRAGDLRVQRIEDLARPGLRLALGSRSVPVGSYADGVLALLPSAVRGAILRNVATREPDASGVVGKLRAGAVDAAIVYRTDVFAARGELTATGIPIELRPTTPYSAAVVSGTDSPREARALVGSLRAGSGRRILAERGFLPPGGQR